MTAPGESITLTVPRYACVGGVEDNNIEILDFNVMTGRGLANFYGSLVVFEGSISKCSEAEKRKQ